MKVKIPFFNLLITLVFVHCIDAQEVLKIMNRYVLIDMNRSGLFSVGDKCSLYRPAFTGDIKTGTVEIVTFRQGKCAAKIISVDVPGGIQVGDYLQKDEADLDYLYQHAPSESSVNSAYNYHSADSQYPIKKNNTLAYIAAGAGLGMLAFGYYSQDRADNTYLNYEKTYNSDDADALYNKTVKLDKQSQISYGIGGAALAFGLFKLIADNVSRSEQSAAFADKPQSIYFATKPNNLVGSACAGFKLGNFVPFMGLDFIWLSVTGDFAYDGQRFWPSSSLHYSSVENIKVDFNGQSSLFIPHFGLKCFLSAKQIKPYLCASYFYSIPKVNFHATWERDTYDLDNIFDNEFIDYDHERETYDFEDIDEDIKDGISDLLHFYGITIGGGGEYYLSKHFSFGGEYGIRMFFNKVSFTHEETKAEPTDIYEKEWDSALMASFKINYAVACLNFYF